MNKDELRWMLSELTEKNAVIRGYAQMALECDHPEWAMKYIFSIIQHIDKLTVLTSIITDLYLTGKDDGCDTGDAAALASIAARAESIKLH
ncbi:hypothetical protein [Pelotomaculum propionicicum]|uniref:Uncharacterized protein n=1 Tax=Pelotomaculum propionicicum TaxID=258475 RepID=A0A4Y7RXX2_9FIRM|nr:hypothetical protein [Pelotomaculum propionicicum]NLI13527.1 hypothetical protein [Peptococcaceae bacterium]TEB13761.1 hypothetical protein Pmgp_00169 [Pelotomaculum propionicicum]